MNQNAYSNFSCKLTRQSEVEVSTVSKIKICVSTVFLSVKDLFFFHKMPEKSFSYLFWKNSLQIQIIFSLDFARIYSKAIQLYGIIRFLSSPSCVLRLHLIPPTHLSRIVCYDDVRKLFNPFSDPPPYPSHRLRRCKGSTPSVIFPSFQISLPQPRD